MAGQENRDERDNIINGVQAVPFESVEEAWFWFIQARLATTQGARIKAGAGKLPRPCEPYDILMIVNDLYRKRRLLMDHAKVLRHYGERLSPPDPWNVREGRAYRLWQEAMQRLEPVLWRRGIIAAPVVAEPVCAE